MALALAFTLFGTLTVSLSWFLSYHVRGHSLPLAGGEFRVNAFAALGLIGSGPSAVGLWCTRKEIQSLIVYGRNESDALPVVLNRYRFLVRTQRIFLSLLSTVVAIAVVQTNALRNALIDSSLATIRDFPPEFVIFYGLIFALAVSCVYLPPAYELRQAGMSLQRAVVDMTSSAPTEGSTPVEQWISRFERETKVAHDLGLDVSILARVQTSLGLLAPLLVSIASTMFPK